MIYIGIDPGMSGGVSFIGSDGKEPTAYKFNDMTEMDMHKLIGLYANLDDKTHAMLERVGAFPGQGVSSTWKFAQHYGFLIGILTAQGIPFELVSPVKWQTAMGCRTGGDKNVSKAAAQRLFPNIKMTHAIADAILISEYCRRTVIARNAEDVIVEKSEEER